MTKPKSEKKVESKPITKNEPEAAKEKLVVFAFRLKPEERDRIHKAAGPGKATKFVRAACLAAASGDKAAFEGLLAQAKTNLP